MTFSNEKLNVLKRILALALAVLMILSGNGSLFSFAGSNDDVLLYADGKLTVNASAAVNANADNWENTAAKAAGLASLPTQLTAALEGYTVCEVSSDLVKDIVFIAAYEEIQNSSYVNGESCRFLIAAINRGSSGFKTVVAVENDGTVLSMSNPSAETIVENIDEKLPEIIVPIPEITPEALDLPPQSLTQDTSSDQAIDAPAPGQTDTPAVEEDQDQVLDQKPDTSGDTTDNPNGNPDTDIVDQNGGGQDSGIVDQNGGGQDSGIVDQNGGGQDSDIVDQNGGGQDSGIVDQNGGGQDSADKGQDQQPAESDTADQNGGGSESQPPAGKDRDQIQSAPSLQNLVGSATNSLKKLKSLLGAASTVSDPPSPTSKADEAPDFDVAAGAAASFTFTTSFPPARTDKNIAIEREEVSLYGKDQRPEGDEHLTIPDAGIDPQLVYGIKYECFLQEDLSLADVAGKSITVDLTDFSKVFNLGDTGADGTAQSMRITLADSSFDVGHITLNAKEAEAVISYFDAETLQNNLCSAAAEAKIADVKKLSAACWMSCSFDNDKTHDTSKKFVTIGTLQIKLDWSNVTSKQPACDIDKTAGAYDKDTQTLLWNIKLTPSRGATLANTRLTDRLGTSLTFDPTIEGAFIITQGDTELSITSTSKPSPTVTNKAITYTFPADDAILEGIDLTKELTITIKTIVKDSFFAAHLGTEGSIPNTASIEDQKEKDTFPLKEDSATKTFKGGWFSKTGETYTGAHANEVGWSITLNAPVRMQDVIVYDLLPSSLGVNTANGTLTLDNVTWEGKTLTTDQDTETWYQIKALDNKTSDNGDYPSGLKTEITSMKDGETRYLLSFHFADVPAGKHIVKFYAPLTFTDILGTDTAGAASPLKIENKAYVKANALGTGGSGGGWVGGENNPVTASVDYSQAAIEKTGSYNRSDHHLIWQINVNNNKSALTGGIIVTDKIGETLKLAGWEGEFDPALNLTWWTDNNTQSAITMTALTPASLPPDTANDPDIPRYRYEDGTLTIYVQKINRETYHFKIDTEIVGDKVYNCFYEDNAPNTPNAPISQGYSTDIASSATLTYDGKDVTAKASVKVVSKFLAKEAYRREGGNDGTGVPYDPADNSFWWKIQINADQRPMAGPDGTGGPVITDDLPKGFSYLDYELYSVRKVSPDSHYMSYGEALETAATDPQDSLLTVSAAATQVKFSFKDSIDKGYILFVKTKLDPTQIEGKTFTNKCRISFHENGKTCGAEASNTTKINIDGITKTGEQIFVDGKAVYEARWTMDVNRDGLANGFESPVLTDALPTGCALQKDSEGKYKVSIHKLKVSVKMDRRMTTAGSSQVIGEDLAEELADQWDYDEASRTFTFRLPEDSAGTRQYSAYRVVLLTEIDAGKAGTTLENHGTYTGIKEDESASSGSVKVYFFGVAASGVWNKPPVGDHRKALEIKKVSSEANADGVKPVLQGAQFELSFTLNEKTVIWKAATDENGIATIEGIPESAVDLVLTEIKAPAGHVLPAEPALTLQFENGTLRLSLLIENDPAVNPTPEPGTKPHPGRDPNPSPSPAEPEALLPDEEIPAGELPAEDNPADDITIPEEDIPAGPAGFSEDLLPKTGGLSADILYAAGLALIGLGVLIRILEHRRRQ